MSDFEILALVLMILTLVETVRASITKKDDK